MRHALSFAAFAAILLGAGGVGARAWWLHDQNVKAELHAEATATEVSPATEAAWASYVDRRLTAAIHSQGEVVRVDDGLLSQAAFVSRNTPYEVDCDPFMGASVDFGQGDSATSVTVYGAMATLAPNEEQPPPLHVSPQSPASRRLTETLCRRIVDYMQKVMAASQVPLSAGRSSLCRDHVAVSPQGPPQKVIL